MSLPAEPIYETIVTTLREDGSPHLAPLGVRWRGAQGSAGQVLLMPFRPSGTLDNLLATGHAVVNATVDTRIFAGAVTGRRDWPLLPASRIPGMRLANTLMHAELTLLEVQDDPVRPRLTFEITHQEVHGPFLGFNRAQAAVIEGAVLVSRLNMLPAAKIDHEMNYLQIAIDKTATAHEHEAWQWLRDAVTAHRLREASASRAEADTAPQSPAQDTPTQPGEGPSR